LLALSKRLQKAVPVKRAWFRDDVDIAFGLSGITTTGVTLKGPNMRRFTLTVFLSMCLQACGGDTSFVLFINSGSCDFDHDQWAHADHAKRGCMVDSFLSKHHPVGMSTDQVRLLLGEPTGHADDNGDPAYIVGPSGSGLTLVLLFRTDRQTGKVADVQMMPEK
jgi:hypothetical protein